MLNGFRHKVRLVPGGALPTLVGSQRSATGPSAAPRLWVQAGYTERWHEAASWKGKLQWGTGQEQRDGGTLRRRHQL